MKELVVITIPLYKHVPDADELLSLKQCILILSDHPVVFFAPKGFNTSIYDELCTGKILYSFEFFDKEYFTGIEGYNKLMLSAYFYKRFLQYKFILIYQLDALVFKDQLEYWCRQNYDYIGAPQIAHTNDPNEMQFLKGYAQILEKINNLFKTSYKVSNVGNGGFSLRKTKSCYWLLKLLHSKVKKWGYYNEDGFFKYWGNLLRPLFNLPGDNVALRFAIEHEPKESLAKIGNQPPFGCHAFRKYDWTAWEPLIRSNDE